MDSSTPTPYQYLPDPSSPTPVTTSATPANTTAAQSGGVNSGGNSNTITDQSSLPLFGAGSSIQDVQLRPLIINFSNLLLDNATLIAGTLAVFFLIWGGISYITSAGDSAKAKAARATIVNVIIGVVVIVSAIAIIRFGVGIGQSLTNSAQP